MRKNFETEQYTWALFIGHLTIEKLIKAIYAKINIDNPYPPKIHNLNILAERCTKEYAFEQIKNIEEIRIWLKEILRKSFCARNN